ncbi:MAG TPA: YeeE/YedE family protein [Paraburkholderia sp.]|jgi:uncharacterized membrane protein YedE/YeeE|nr:YeeE/YedE family protein [Paraburkholderia sp.]
MLIVNALLAGFVFGLGLLVSGMANPAKVLGFLDLAGRWDPSLAFVMVGAILVSTLAFHVARRRAFSMLGAPMQIPPARRIDRRLLAGSLLFGAGWGLAGFCPGPAIVSAGSAQPKAWLFVAAMVLGMTVFTLIERRRAIRN